MKKFISIEGYIQLMAAIATILCLMVTGFMAGRMMVTQELKREEGKNQALAENIKSISDRLTQAELALKDECSSRPDSVAVQSEDPAQPGPNPGTYLLRVRPGESVEAQNGITALRITLHEIKNRGYAEPLEVSFTAKAEGVAPKHLTQQAVGDGVTYAGFLIRVAEVSIVNASFGIREGEEHAASDADRH